MNFEIFIALFCSEPAFGYFKNTQHQIRNKIWLKKQFSFSLIGKPKYNSNSNSSYFTGPKILMFYSSVFLFEGGNFFSFFRTWLNLAILNKSFSCRKFRKYCSYFGNFASSFFWGENQIDWILIWLIALQIFAISGKVPFQILKIQKSSKTSKAKLLGSFL